MFEGKERRRQLIEELRTTHALQAPEQKIKKQEAGEIDKKKAQEKRLLHKVRIVPFNTGYDGARGGGGGGVGGGGGGREGGESRGGILVV